MPHFQLLLISLKVPHRGTSLRWEVTPHSETLDGYNFSENILNEEKSAE